MSSGRKLIGGNVIVVRIAKGRVANANTAGLSHNKVRNGSEEIARRLQQLSREVAEGKRTAHSLIAIPAALGKVCTT
jgi:hypothetical protein